MTFDTHGRTLEDFDATQRKTTTEWVDVDGPLVASVTDAAQRRTTFLYDSSFRLTDTYGPAPTTPTNCFGADRRPNGSCAAMPHTSTQYDGGMQGLAAAYWANPNLDGDTGAHNTVGGAGGDISGTDWTANPPAAMLGTTTWSARLSGEFVFATSGTLEFSLGGSGTRALWVDGALVPDGGAVTGTAGSRHPMVIEYVPSGTANLQIRSRPPGGSYSTVAATSLAPAYGLPTLATVGDATPGSPPQVTAVEYAVAHTGQPTAVIVDPAGAALDTRFSYEPSTPGGFGRLTEKKLPAGNATAYGYYANNAVVTNPCGTGSANQAGLPKITTAPDPDGPANPQAPRATEVVRDKAGRPVATRVGSEPWTCITYDPRGRIATRTVPAFGGTPARTVTYNHAVGNDARVTSVSDTAGTITTTADLVGRITNYTDATGNTTTSTYDHPGRLIRTTGPQLGWSTDTEYDTAGRPTLQKIDGATVATASYDAAGELSGADYPVPGGNGTKLASVGRDPAGRTVGLTWTTAANTPIASDAVVRSQSGRVMSETVDSVPTAAFTYDGPGRLVTTTVPGHTLSYGYASTSGCGTLATAGDNTNRTSVTDNGGTPKTYCYDNADRLTFSSDAAVGTPVYDSHGNTTTLGNQTLAYDGANRHTSTITSGTTTVTYVRDATDRIVERRVNGVAVARYGYAGPGDGPAFTSYGLLLLAKERSFGLVGGVTLSKGGPNGDVWSYPNIHGDVMAVANSAGVKVGSTATYDPFGRALTTGPDNRPGNFDYGWLGAHQRPTEHEAGAATIEMGARPYVPSLGRFLEADPVDGGSANDYEYGGGDPVNATDLLGLCIDKIDNDEQLWTLVKAEDEYCTYLGYHTEIVEGKAGRIRIDPQGSCTGKVAQDIFLGPGGGSRARKAFRDACRAHDYLYDVLRKSTSVATTLHSIGGTSQTASSPVSWVGSVGKPATSVFGTKAAARFLGQASTLLSLALPGSRVDLLGRKDVVVKFPVVAVMILSLARCGLGTAPGRDYDFSQLEPVIDPVRELPSLEVVRRQEIGSDCRGQGCQRPLLSYGFRPTSPAGCELVQRILGTFQGITQPFRPTEPGRVKCGYVGEVQRRTVTVAALVTPGLSELIPETGSGVAGEIAVSVAADGRE